MFWSVLHCQQALGCVIMIRIRGVWWWQQWGHRGPGIVSVTSIVKVSSHRHRKALVTPQQPSNEKIHVGKKVIVLTLCALFLISQYGEDERSPGPGKCSVRILWHLLTFIPRAPVLISCHPPVAEWSEMTSLNHPEIPSDGGHVNSQFVMKSDNLVPVWWCVDLVPMWTIIWHKWGISSQVLSYLDPSQLWLPRDVRWYAGEIDSYPAPNRVQIIENIRNVPVGNSKWNSCSR